MSLFFQLLMAVVLCTTLVLSFHRNAVSMRTKTALNSSPPSPKPSPPKSIFSLWGPKKEDKDTAVTAPSPTPSPSLAPKSTFSLWGLKKEDNEDLELGRLAKNIMFPGIYREYADTKETKKTIKIDTKKNLRSRNDIDSFFSQDSKSGTYNVADASTIPKYDSLVALGGKKLQPVRKPANFIAPTPKKVGNINSGLSCIPNVNTCLRPKKPIVIYEFESSADCKKVREACSVLDLIVEYRPCPGATSGFADMLQTASLGQRQVPYMVDVNPSMYRPQLFGAEEIVKHLFNTYGPGEAAIPKNMKGGGSKVATGKTRPDARPDNTSMKPITLYGFEGANYVKQVRQALTDLGLAHIMVNCANGSANRAKLVSKTGVLQVPYISDPNTGVEMFESAEIVKYLTATYTASK